MSIIIDFLKSVAGICNTKELSQDLWRLERNNIILHSGKIMELKKPGGAVYLKGKGLSKPILVVHTQNNEYVGFTNKCTHIGGRRLDPVPGQSLLRCCSVSHSTFDLKGNVISGPAKKKLTTYKVEKTDEGLIIYLDEKTC